MTEALSPARVPASLVRARRVTQIAAVVLVILGLLVITGWFFHLPGLLQVRPGQFAMVFSTALCFVLAGVALLVTGRQPHRVGMRKPCSAAYSF